MVAEPAATALTTPEEETVAIAVADEDHVTVWLTLEGETVAVKAEVPPTVKVKGFGEIVTEETDKVETVTVVVSV
jgi:hypothetical protein